MKLKSGTLAIAIDFHSLKLVEILYISLREKSVSFSIQLLDSRQFILSSLIAAERTVKVGSRRFKSNQVYEKKFGVQTEKERQKARREKKMSNRKKKYLEQQEEAKANKEGETNKVNDVKKEETSDLEPNVIEIKTEDELKNENESDVEIKSEDESSDEEMNSNDDSEGESVSDSDVESESDSMASPSPAKGASKVKGESYLKYGEIDASNIVYSNVNTSLEDSYDNCKKLVRGKNYKSMLHKIESRKMKVEKLRAVNPKMAANLEKDDRWDKAMKRAQGFKIMDNVVKLKRLQHKKDAKKRSSKLKWEVSKSGDLHVLYTVLWCEDTMDCY